MRCPPPVVSRPTRLGRSSAVLPRPILPQLSNVRRRRQLKRKQHRMRGALRSSSVRPRLVPPQKGSFRKKPNRLPTKQRCEQKKRGRRPRPQRLRELQRRQRSRSRQPRMRRSGRGSAPRRRPRPTQQIGGSCRQAPLSATARWPPASRPASCPSSSFYVEPHVPLLLASSTCRSVWPCTSVCLRRSSSSRRGWPCSHSPTMHLAS